MTETEDKPSCVMESLTIHMILFCDKQLEHAHIKAMKISPNFRVIRTQVKTSNLAYKRIDQYWAETIAFVIMIQLRADNLNIFHLPIDPDNLKSKKGKLLRGLIVESIT